MRFRFFTTLCLLATLLGYAAPGHTQSPVPPNRKAEVASIRPRFCAGVPGDDVSRRRIIVTVVNELNKIDNGNWKLLYRLDREDEDPRQGRLTSDVIVWGPTREHFDVLSESGTIWLAHGLITDPDWRIISPTDLGGFPGCAGTVPPAPPTPPADPPFDPAPLLSRIAALEAQAGVLLSELNAAKATAASLAAANQELAAGLAAAHERVYKLEQKPWPPLKCSGRVSALFGLPISCNVVPDVNP